MNFETMSKQRKMILIAAAVGVISMFLPWVSILGYSASGMHGAGILVFLCFLAAGFLSFTGDQTTNLNRMNWMLTLVAGGIALLIMVINFFDGLSAIGLYGIGFWGALIASICIVAFTYMYRSTTDSLQTGFDTLKNSFNNTSSPQTGTTTTTSTPNVTHTPTNDPPRPNV